MLFTFFGKHIVYLWRVWYGIYGMFIRLHERGDAKLAATVKKGIKKAISDYRSSDKEAAYFFTALAFFVMTVLIFMHLLFDYYSKGGWSYDSTVYAYLQGMRNDVLDAFFKIITHAGNTIPVIITTAGISAALFFILKRKEYVYFAVNVPGAWLLNELLKSMIRRPRPIDGRLIDLTNMTRTSKEFSFPSGHSMVIMVIAIMLLYFILLYSKKSFAAYLVCALILLSALLIGISRVYLGVHYFSDVVAGWTAGILWASGSIMVHRLGSCRRRHSG